MATNDDIFDRSTVRQSRWLRFANGVSRSALTRLAAGEDVLEAYLRRRFERIQFAGPVMTRTAVERLASILRGARRRSGRTFSELLDVVRDGVFEAGDTEADLEVASLRKAVGDRPLNRPERRTLRRALRQMPINGHRLGDLIRRIRRDHDGLVEGGVRIAAAARENAEAVVRRIFGTRRLGRTDGMLEPIRRRVDGTVRDAVVAATGRMRELVASINPAVKSLEWSAILDSRICPTCVNLDGRRFEPRVGPRPPAHPRCRCQMVNILRGEPEPQRRTAAQWLRDQSTEVQDDVLGVTRARLWRAGKITLDKMVDDRQRVLTLAQLKRLEGVDLLDEAA